MAESVTTGMELNSYQGNAALAATGNDVGYAKIELSPLQDYALKKYETNYRDFEQQQKDKTALEEQYLDPSIHVSLDQQYADQMNPKLERFQELAKSNLQKNPESSDWYEFKNLYAEIGKENAKLKTVQTLKENAKKASGESADPHEKEKLNAYVKQLDGYKLGQEIPIYNKHFGYNELHMPALQTKTGTFQRLNGNNLETVETTINNAMGADVLAKRKLIENPEATNTYADIAHTLLEKGGVEEVNNAMADAYNKSIRLNFEDLKSKYKKEYADFLKGNPNLSFQDFMRDTGRGNEIEAVRHGHQYLIKPIEYIPASQDGRELAGYTYITDEQGNKLRLDRPDSEIAAIYAATHKPIGFQEKVIDSKVSKTPAEIALLKSKQALVGEQKNTQKSIQAKNYAAASKIKKQTQQLNPLPPSEVPLIGREAEVFHFKDPKTGNLLEKQILIKGGKIPDELRKKAGFGNAPVKPKPTGKEAADAAALQSYNTEKAKYDKGVYQMRFFDAQGRDLTLNVINKLANKKGSINDAVNAAIANGIVVKFIDTDGNIVSTTESIDRQTLIQNNKANTKGDEPLGTDLPPEDVDL